MKILKFEAGWCKPCKDLTVAIEKFVSPLIDIEKIDIEDTIGRLRSKLHNVRGVPTLVMIDDTGIEIKRMVGFNSVKELEEFVNG